MEAKDIANEPFHRWLVWLDPNSPPELVEEVTRMDGAIKAARDRQEYLTQDKETRELYEMREKARRDYVSGLNGARREGEAKGKAEEREKWQGVVANKDAEIATLREQLMKGSSTG